MVKASKETSAEAKRRSLRSLKAISVEEDRAITKAARSDPDAPLLTDAFFERKKLSRGQVAEIAKVIRRSRGRPVSERKKVAVTIRLDPEIVAALRAEGPGWQTRLNAWLAQWTRRKKVA